MIREPLDVASAERRKMPRPPARRIFVTKPSEPNGNGCHGGMEGKSVQAVPPQVPRPPNLPRPPPPGSLGGGRGGGGDHSGARRPAQKGPPPQRHVANCEEKDRNPIDELSSAATADDQVRCRKNQFFPFAMADGLFHISTPKGCLRSGTRQNDETE